MQFNQHEMVDIQKKLQDSLRVIKMYEWLLDSYVLDFYIDSHWEKMPKSWKDSLANVMPEYLADLLVPPEKSTEKIVWPLSLLALRKLLQRLCIPRETDPIRGGHPTDQNDLNNNPNCNVRSFPSAKIKMILMRKKIKAKKQHEIERMGQLTADIANKLNVKYIVDFGSGLGHLARLLAYGYGLNVCCLEKQETLTDQANELDNQSTNLIHKLCPSEMGTQKLMHLNCCLSRDTSFKDLIQEIRNSFKISSNDEAFRFGIIGLHPCGDLASILINFFLENVEPKFLNLVGCCYFKITLSTSTAAASTNGSDANENAMRINSIGYPLSDYLLKSADTKWPHLSFEAREIACHAIEVYAQRLAQSNYDNLRVHSYRAAIEQIICKYWPERKHSGLRSIKRLTTFREYCKQAVSHLDGVHIPDIDIDSGDTIENLNNWKSVVIFYSLRLMLAPIIESVILYDRMLCLLERGCQTTIEAIFDPFVSARNHIITAIRS